MMLRQSPFRWLILAGIMLFLSGFLLDRLCSKKGIIHLVVGIPVNQVHYTGLLNAQGKVSDTLGFDVQLDSMHIGDYPSSYELQLREIDQEFSQGIHTSMLPPAHLVEAFPFQPMKILRIRDTEYLFRLKQFYPDFSFQYSYPENQDTIPPRAPGITLNLITSGKEELLTLRSDQKNARKLDDVVDFGCTLEFFWTFSKDSLARLNSDSGKIENKIVFAGKDKKVFFLFNKTIDSFSLELNHFYPIPGKDSLGFIVLQSFPDVKLLKAVPVSKSDQILNPVAEVEIWKKGGRSQNLYLYPNAASRHGGEWRVPGTRQLLTLATSNKALLNACKCMISINNAEHHVSTSKLISGPRLIRYKGNSLMLSECDPNGIWADLKVWTTPGYFMKFTGVVMVMVGFLGLLMQWIRSKPSLMQPSSG